MSSINDTAEFLQGIFPDWEQHAIFAHSKAGGGMAHTRDWRHLDVTRDCYWCIAAFPDDGKTTRSLSRAQNVRALVIDDVGTKVPAASVERALGQPTAEVITSEGNFQWTYRLSRPVAVREWPAFFAAVERMVEVPLEGRDAVHLFRLPMGFNTKPARGGFDVQPGDGDPEAEIDAAGFIPPGDPAASREHGGTLQLDDPAGLMALIPNTIETRDEWGNEICHQLWALTGGSEAGFEAWDAWSSWHPSYDAAATRTYWASIHGVTTSGRGLLVRAEKLDPEGYAAWMAREAAVMFDDGAEMPLEPPKSKGITATPFRWIDPHKIPPRDWLYGRILIRQFISMTVAPGGVGKSSLIAVEALAQVTGRNLLGEDPSRALRVWLWNLEDPHMETQRKLQAAAAHYGIDEAAMGGRLFVDSGRDQRLVIAEMDRNKPRIVRPVVGALVEQIKLRKIDIVVVDPYVSCHGVPENDNMGQDMVVKEWGRVADQGMCAVHLIDHTSKAGSQEVVTDSSRGAKAKTDAARIVRVVNRMTKNEGEKVFGIKDPWRYFHTFNDKANMAPPASARDWFYLESTKLGNGTGAAEAFSINAGAIEGDEVGVVRRWLPPSAQDLVTGDSFKAMTEAMGAKEWREAPQAGEKWIGIAAAQALSLDPNTSDGRKAIKEVLARWFSAGLLKEVTQIDEHRKPRKFIKIMGGF